MLIEIRCDHFREETISFHEGLNVVLGDDNATNSIGKSTLLMVIDFALGGDSLLEHNTDIINELGHHDYWLSFRFQNEIFRFRRSTFTPSIVYPCDDNSEPGDPIRIDEFTAFLKSSYGVPIEDISFRALVGLYARVWGKDNLNVHKPLHIVQTQSAKICVDRLLQTYDKYGDIKDLALDLKKAEENRDALRHGFRNRIIPRIGKRAYKDNAEKLEKIEAEIEDIKTDLAKYATNISEIANREVLDLKLEKDSLLEIELELKSKLARVRRNLEGNRYIKSRHFAGLTHFFPEVDSERLASVEEFHSGLAKILKSELKTTMSELEARLGDVRSEIEKIDAKLASTFKALDNPSVIVDRVFELSSDLQTATRENEYFENDEQLSETIRLLSDKLSHIRRNAIERVEAILNDNIRRIVSSVFGADRKSPRIEVSESNYSYEVFEDTGTGTAYSSLIVLDLAVFKTTALPVLIHDSVLFKNVENDSVANLVDVYAGIHKQSFIAIDEVDKYGKAAAKLLRDRKAIQLTNERVLYKKDWRIN